MYSQKMTDIKIIHKIFISVDYIDAVLALAALKEIFDRTIAEVTATLFKRTVIAIILFGLITTQLYQQQYDLDSV
jgi:uncharacterized membrane protein